MLLAQLAGRILDRHSRVYPRLFEGELGLIESLTAAVLLLAVGYSIRLAVAFARQRQRFLGTWFGLFSLGSFLFFGEEVSWGQHWIGFEPPEFFQTHNIQNETNLHNLSKGTERHLKLAVALALLGGVFAGWRWRRRDRSGTPRQRLVGWLLPGPACVPSALLAVSVYAIERFRTWFDPDWGLLLTVSLKETFELYLAFIMAVYAFSAWHRRDRAP